MHDYILAIDASQSESEPELEVWEDELLQDTEPPDPIDNCTSFDTVPSSSRALSNWILRFFMVMQAAFRLPDTVIGYFLQFFVVLFVSLSSTVRSEKRLPNACHDQCIKLSRF